MDKLFIVLLLKSKYRSRLVLLSRPELQTLIYNANIPLFLSDDFPIPDEAKAKMLWAQGLAVIYL